MPPILHIFNFHQLKFFQGEIFSSAVGPIWLQTLSTIRIYRICKKVTEQFLNNFEAC